MRCAKSMTGAQICRSLLLDDGAWLMIRARFAHWANSPPFTRCPGKMSPVTSPLRLTVPAGHRAASADSGGGPGGTRRALATRFVEGRSACPQKSAERNCPRTLQKQQKLESWYMNSIPLSNFQTYSNKKLFHERYRLNILLQYNTAFFTSFTQSCIFSSKLWLQNRVIKVLRIHHWL